MRKKRNSFSVVLLMGLVVLGSIVKPSTPQAQLMPDGAIHSAAAATNAPTSVPVAEYTPFPKDDYNSHTLGYFLFATGWFKDEFARSQVYGLIDTINQAGNRAIITLIVDDLAWTSGREIHFDQSLHDAGVTQGDILLMYCEAMEPVEKWKDGEIILDHHRAVCHYYEKLSPEEQEKIYGAIENFYD